MSNYYGSLQNRLMEHSATPEMTIGMGVTECCWSDRHAYEIVAIKDDRHITIRRMNAVLVGDFYDQNYELTSNPEGHMVNLFKTQKGEWKERIGRCLGATRFAVGVAREYYDPSF